VVAWLATAVVGQSGTLAITLLAVPDSYSVQHDRTLTVAAPGVLANDIGILGEPMPHVDSGPWHGELTLDADGGFTYTPENGYVGEDDFQYHVHDGLLSSLPTTVTITVTNIGPVAKADGYAAATGVELSVPAPGVLSNDTDADGDELTAELVDGGGNGSLDLNGNGSFTFKSGGSFVGDRTFTYRVWDGIAWSNVATVTIRVGSSPTPTPMPTPAPTPTPLPTLPPLPTPPPLLPTLPPGVTPTPRPTPAGPTASPDARPSPSIDTSIPRGSAAPGSTTTPGGPSSTEPPSGSSGFGVGGGTESDGGAAIGGLDAVTGAALGSLPGGLLAWSYPAIVMTLPGILLLIAIGAQALGALAWLPIVRRRLGGFGVQGKRENG
jgi:hypothetical protein